MKFAATTETYAYWKNCRGARTAPAHSDIDWIALRHLAANMFVIQDSHRRNYRVSYSGTRINALWLGARDGQRFSDLWDERDRDGVRMALESAAETASPIVAGVRCAPPGAESLDLELMLLPLRRLEQSDAQFLGALALPCEPDWLGQKAVSGLKLSSFRVIREHESGAKGLRLRARPNPSREPRPRPKFVVHTGGKV